MSIIASLINKYGIILASDSNLTSKEGNAGFGQKIFPIPYLNAGLAYTGSYYVNGKQLDIWMKDFIGNSYSAVNSIQAFCESLTECLTNQMRDHELENATIIHVAGYQTSNNKSHAEHWNISNTDQDKRGNYEKPQKKFSLRCTFNSGKNQLDRKKLLRFQANQLAHQFLINGLQSARVSLVNIKINLDEILSGIWSNDSWKFRKPDNIFETAAILKLYFIFVSELFKMSDYEALYIGGEIQTYLISVPENIDLEFEIS